MISFDRFTLDNGLKVLVHQDSSTPIVAMNTLYNVGSRDEEPGRTGFAHLFEHLMFGGSINIPRYDEPLEQVGGENNAFTNNDLTDYYLTLPKQNLETAFWLESDRMLDLAFSEKSLEVQKNVVVEEFKQNYLNQPYGDAWLLLRPLAYKIHPYQWPTIGKEPSHIAKAKMEDVKAFYQKYYNPCNAILVVAGDVLTTEIKKLTEKWFGPIRKGQPIDRHLPVEPEQTEARIFSVERNVPYHSIYKCWHMCSRSEPEYYATDMISDLLSASESSRLYQELIKEKQLFSEINAFVTGDMDAGLFVISGKLVKGVSFEQAEEALDQELNKLKSEPVKPKEMQKIRNHIESMQAFSEMRVLDKAINLAYYELLGDARLVNELHQKYAAVRSHQVMDQAQKVLQPENCSTLYYNAY